ncbi:uncharacterized protein BHQ10_001467 [Talaromyces amestolkiae]|uniref:DUF7136 domain-containing protein n=1 Tax=Talaromyces amestolkiae TaxID=1196081 RepID=A0A364KPJ9_TALAM|nr:uncharacterized protein BHQ10_001467 [Talaromyces amestolkiae]RAO65455.1 hypothetical protein BHQ10_001467 [Talaromyces amestolkiae]
MTRLLRFIALAGITYIPLAYSATTNSPASASNTSGIEVDIIFPIHNATYNITESLPIVFALQNLTAAAAIGPFTFEWDIMPYGNVGELQEPGGVLNDFASVYFTTGNATTEPYILVNQTDVQKWQYGPYYPHGSVYALQWNIQWDVDTGPCDSARLGMLGTLFFNINLNDPEPNLTNVTGQCPQLGAVYQINTAAKNSSCSAVVTNNGTGDPCAVTLDQARVANISSTWKGLVAASTATTSASATATSSPAKKNFAVGSNVPFSYMLVATLLGSLQMIMS